MNTDWLSAFANLFAAVGTVGAFIVGGALLRREAARDRSRFEQETRAQASGIHAWIEVADAKVLEPVGDKLWVDRLHDRSPGRAGIAGPSVAEDGAPVDSSSCNTRCHAAAVDDQQLAVKLVAFGPPARLTPDHASAWKPRDLIKMAGTAVGARCRSVERAL